MQVCQAALLAAAFLSYEARTGLNPALNIPGVLKIFGVLWAGNSAAMPLRIAAAAALAPLMDKVGGRPGCCVRDSAALLRCHRLRLQPWEAA